MCHWRDSLYWPGIQLGTQASADEASISERLISDVSLVPELVVSIRLSSLKGGDIMAAELHNERIRLLPRIPC